MSVWLKRRVRSALARLLRVRSGGRVFAGPFRGMLIPDSPHADLTVRFLLGTHEMELRDAIEQLPLDQLRTIINCGAGQGYYAVGLALRCPHARVVAYETVAERRRTIQRAAEINGVADRLDVRAACDADALRRCLGSAPHPVLVVADVEGAELAVFDAEATKLLSPAVVLIETHDHEAPGTTDQLRARFAASHRVDVYAPQPRTRGDLPPQLSSGPGRVLAWLFLRLLRESRAHDQRWLLFTPRAAARLADSGAANGGG